jgi:hypothetical protein
MIYGICAAVVLTVLGVFKGSGSFIKSVSTSALGGVGALCAVNTLSYFIPLGIGFNLFTISFSVLFSVPGVITLLLCEALLF